MQFVINPIAGNPSAACYSKIKAEHQGGMKSLWTFMRARHLDYAIRSSLENFGQFDYVDHEAGDAVRHVDVYPLYALSQLPI